MVQVRGAALALALGALGCASVPPASVRREVALTLHGDTRFSQEERWIVEAAADAWARFTAGRVRVAIAWDLDEAAAAGGRARGWARLVRDDGRGRGARLMAQARTGGGDPVVGWVDHGPPVVVHVVADRVPELYPVVLHELGHVAGLPDLEPEARAVMTPGAGRWAFSAADRAACEAFGVCVGD